MRTRMLLLAVVVAAPGVAAAQLDPAVKIGARVRVDRAGAQIAGRIIEIHGDTIVVRNSPADTSVALSLRDATTLAVHGRSKGAETFAHTLGVMTAAAGVALYVNWCVEAPEECRSLEEDEDPYDDEDPFPVFGTWTLGFGAVGLLLGYALTPPRWRTIPLPFRVGVAPSSDGFAVYVSLPAPRLRALLR